MLLGVNNDPVFVETAATRSLRRYRRRRHSIATLAAGLGSRSDDVGSSETSQIMRRASFVGKVGTATTSADELWQV